MSEKGQTDLAARPGSWGFALTVLAAFVAVVALCMATHEMWGDELMVWNVGRDSTSLTDFFHNYRWYGHPPLWYLLVYGIAHVTQNPAAMQVAQLLIISAAMLVFLRRAPFSRPLKALFVFGYFPLFEYGMLARNYAPAVLGLFLFCALYRSSGPRRWVAMSLALLLMAGSNILALILSVALAAMLVFEAATDPAARATLRARRAPAIAAAAIFGVGVLLFALLTIPRADCVAYTTWRTYVDPVRVGLVVSSVWKGYVPLPQPTWRFWDTNIVPWGAAQAILSVGLLAVGAWIFRRRRTVLFFYLFATATLFAFAYLKFNGYTRHFGHHFLVLMACAWMYASVDAPEEAKHRRIAGALLAAVLVVQLAAGMWATAMCWTHVFSPGKAVADYLRVHRLDDHLLIGHKDLSMCSITGYNGRRFFFLRGCRMGTFPMFDNAPFLPSECDAELARLAPNYPGDPVVILTDTAWARSGDKLLATFPPGIAPEETYYIYLRPSPAK